MRFGPFVLNLSTQNFSSGTLIPKSCVEALREALSADAEKTEVVNFEDEKT